MVFLIFWQAQLVPYETEWGDLGTWAAAVFTGGGLVFAGISARSAAQSVREQTNQRTQVENTRVQEENDLKMAMAHSVAVSSWWAKDTDGAWRACYRVVNKSPYPINRVTVTVWDVCAGDDPWSKEAFDLAYAGRDLDWSLERVVGTMLPGDELAEAVAVNHPMAGPRPFIHVDPVSVNFTDVWGKNWMRSDMETKENDAASCMCQACMDSTPPEKILWISQPSPARPQVIKYSWE